MVVRYFAFTLKTFQIHALSHTLKHSWWKKLEKQRLGSQTLSATFQMVPRKPQQFFLTAFLSAYKHKSEVTAVSLISLTIVPSVFTAGCFTYSPTTFYSNLPLHLSYAHNRVNVSHFSNESRARSARHSNN